ncbi:MAG: hypothetical protein U0Q55_22980 [Vicinamibacterales bacterium]
MATFAIVSAKIATAVRRWAGTFRSNFGQLISAGGRPRSLRRFSNQAPSGIRMRPMRKMLGRTEEEDRCAVPCACRTGRRGDENVTALTVVSHMPTTEMKFANQAYFGRSH